MAHITRQIGLSLGADICWPICFEAILKRLDLAIPDGEGTLGFEASRVTFATGVLPACLRRYS